MVLPVFFTLAVLFTGTVSRANSIDSLETVLAKIDDPTAQIAQSLKWAGKLGINSKSDADYWYAKTVELSIKHNNLKNQIVAFCSWAHQDMIFGDMDLAIGHINDAKQLLSDSVRYSERLSIMFVESTYQVNVGNYEEAKIIRLAEIEMERENGDSSLLAASLHNLGIVYYQLEDYEKTDSLVSEAYVINKRLGNVSYEHANLSMLANVNNALGNHQKAIDYNKQVLVYYDSLGYKNAVCMLTMNLGIVSTAMGKKEDGRRYLLSALDIGLEHHYLDWVLSCYEHLGELEAEEGNYKLALEYKDFAADYSDTLLNEQNINALAKLQKELDDTKIGDLEKDNLLKQKENDEADLLIEKTNLQLYFAAGIGVLLLVLGFILFRGNQNKKKANLQILIQNKQIEEQREHLFQKNKDITDSIQYAKRIQSAILPSANLLMTHLPEHFVYYAPKDIVAGDFYSMIPLEKGVLFAAADCTGHGVPGALVSVVCYNSINRSVREFGLSEPSAILDKTRELVIEQFEKSEDDVKDGMDIGMCVLDGMTLHYSGAHNPLWIIRKGELLETKANKQPIGKFDMQQPFTNHTIQLEKGDTVYVFSDGYADQFGGPKGKKYKSANFKKLLLSIQEKTMADQKESLQEELTAWKGEVEQLDDVCVFGVRV